jgi:transcriptional regulator with XRE-family HTH domain
MSRAELARALRVSQPSLQHIESGDNRISAAQLWQVCGVLGVPVQAMFEDLPNRIWRDRAESETAPLAAAPTSASTGVEEGRTVFDGAPPRAAIARLARAARPLTDAQIEVLVATARSLRR